MSRRLHHAVDRWLRAERGAAAAAAEAELRRVFAALPAPLPPAGFTTRVMQAVGLAPPRRAALPLVWRVALAGAMSLAAVAAATTPGVVLGLLRQITAGDVLRFAAGALVETCQSLAEGLAVWQSVNSVGETLAGALSAPPILAALAAATLLSAGGLRLLHGLLAVERRSENARA